VWFDEFELKLGDSLVAKIDEGLALSQRGILIISPAFLGKEWPEYERQGLTGRDVRGGGGVLIPVWHDVSSDDVAAFSPTLAQRFALVTRGMDIDEIALRVLEEIRPELADGPRRRALFERLLAEQRGPLQMAAVRDPRRPENPVHDSLPPELLRRIRLIQEAVYEALPVSFEETVENFKRDLRPDHEVEIWESIAGIYLAVKRQAGIDSAEGCKELFSLILGGHSMQELDNVKAQHISSEIVDVLKKAFKEIPQRGPADRGTEAV
jgi:hypothetical protein